MVQILEGKKLIKNLRKIKKIIFQWHGGLFVLCGVLFAAPTQPNKLRLMCTSAMLILHLFS